MNIFKYIWKLLLDFDARLRRRFERTAVRAMIDLFRSADIEVDQKIKILHAFCELKKQGIAEMKMLVEFYQAQAQSKAAKPVPKKRKRLGQSLQDVINNVYGLESMAPPVPGLAAPEPPPPVADALVVS